MVELATRRPPQQRRSRDRLELIMDAADELLATRTYEDFSTSSVAAAAGIPAPAVYRFFADKDDLGRALVLRHLERLDEAIQTSIAALEGPSSDEIIVTVFAVYVDYMRTHRSQQILWFDRRIGPSTVAEVQSYTQASSAQHRELAIASGSIPLATTPAEAQILAEMMDRVLELAFRNDRHGDEEILGRGLMLLRAAGAALGSGSS